MYRAIIHGHGQFHEIEAYYLDKVAVTLGADGFVTNDQYQNGGSSNVRVLSRLGQIPEAHYSELTAAFPEWTPAHRLDGLGHSLLVAELPPLDQFNGMFPNREPTLEIVAKSTLVLDPRDGVQKYSDNLALCALDWETSPDGANLAGFVDVPSYVLAADLCDQPVALVNGAVEPRYRFAGSYDLNEEPLSVRNRFLGACAGENFITPEGKLGLRVGAWSEPRFEITDDMVLSFEWEFGSDAIESYNVSAFEYVDPELNFTKVPGDAGLVWPVVAVNLASYGISGTYRVKRRSVDPRSLAVTYELAELNADAFSLSLDQQGDKPTLQGLPDSGSIPVPTGFNAGPVGIQSSQNTFAAGIGVAWITAGESVGEYVVEQDVIALAASGAPTVPTRLNVLDQGGGVARINFVASDSYSLWRTEVYRDGV